MSYVVRMSGLYGVNGYDAYFKEVGDHCFEFVSKLDYATKYDTTEECTRVLNGAKYYLKMYGAQTMNIMAV